MLLLPANFLEIEIFAGMSEVQALEDSSETFRT